MAAQRTYLAISTGVYGYPLGAATQIAVPPRCSSWLWRRLPVSDGRHTR